MNISLKCQVRKWRISIYIPRYLYKGAWYIGCAKSRFDSEVEKLRKAIESHIVFIVNLFESMSLKQCFSTKTHNGWDIALEYIKGLLTNPSRCHLTSISDVFAYSKMHPWLPEGKINSLCHLLIFFRCIEHLNSYFSTM